MPGRRRTRRVVTRGTRFPDFLGGRGQESDLSAWGWSFDGPYQHGYMVLARGLNERYDNGCISIPCPYGDPGDRLWVRETWSPDHRNVYPCYDFVYRADGTVSDRDRTEHISACTEALRAQGRQHGECLACAGFRWRPSIHMPRRASRITLEVTEVRVQRLQEVSEDDALAEGIEKSHNAPWLWRAYGGGPPFVYPRASFRSLWDSINGEREGCSWDANPFVWAISFKVLP